MRQLIILMIAAGFIEMLTPENSLKKTVKLVIGLMVMAVLLQPLTRLFKINMDPDAILSMSQSVVRQDSRQIVERGLQLRDRWQESFDLQQHALVKEKIESVVGLIDDIELREVRFFPSTTSRSSRVSIIVGPALDRGISKTCKDKLIQKIQKSVRLVCNIANEQIEVIWDENR